MELNQASQIPTSESVQENTTNLPIQTGIQDDHLKSDQTRAIAVIVIVFLILLAATIAGVWFLARADVAEVARIRDIFIIFLAVQSLFTGIALVVLLVQLAQLINLLKNEVKPILESTNQTVSTLRGTTNFLSNNLVEPVIKLNEYLAGLTTFLQTVGLMKRSAKKNPSKGE